MSKTALITGGAGFIAHHLIDKILSTTDWEIITLDRLDFSGNLNRLNEIVLILDSETSSLALYNIKSKNTIPDGGLYEKIFSPKSSITPSNNVEITSDP